MCPNWKSCCVVLLVVSSFYMKSVSQSTNLNSEGIIVIPKVTYENILGQNVTLVLLDQWLLMLEDSGSIKFASDFKADWIEAHSTTKQSRPKCNYKLGVIQGLESRSHAAMSICGTLLTGYFQSEGNFYVVEPMSWKAGQHKLVCINSQKTPRQPRSLNPNWLFNLTGDTIDIVDNNFDDEDVDYPDPTPDVIDDDERTSSRPDLDIHVEYLRRPQSSELFNDDVGYFYDSPWNSFIIEEGSWENNILQTQWLEIAIGVDHTVIAFHGRDRVQDYVLALMNIVSAVYQDPSLGANINLVISRLIFYEHRKHGMIRLGNARKSLENVNAWNRKLHKNLKGRKSSHDIAIWLTRLDIGGPSGYAPVGGVCNPKRSCALIKDEGLTSAFIIAHEIAHLLGLTHDGDKKTGNICEDEANLGSVMAPMVSATFGKFVWSSCSRREFGETAGNWTCLSDAPRSKNEILLNASLTTDFSMDEQCRMEFGDGYLMCRAFIIKDPCSHLWCGHRDRPHVCKTKKGPPLEGTECGDEKWCIKGICSDYQHSNETPVVLYPQNGGWSVWKPWGPCSRTCGIGVHYRSRFCDNPKPSYGGSPCEGPSEEYDLCNMGLCLIPADLRAQQCRKMPKVLNVSDSNITDVWLPYESSEDNKKCKLTCLNAKRKQVVSTKENLTDGTPCSYDDEDRICIQGQCQKIGCDGQLNSTKLRNSCGVCDGDETHCTNVDFFTEKKLKKAATKIAVLPTMSRHMQLSISPLFNNRTLKKPSIAIVFKNRKKRDFIVVVPYSTLDSKIVEGSQFFFKKISGRIDVWATGPLLTELLVMVVAPTKQVTEGITIHTKLQYSIQKDQKESKRFVWIAGGWGPCSKSCGGGKRHTTIGCWDTQLSKLVKKKHCSLLLKPAIEVETCNDFGCEVEWIKHWSPCSAICGLTAMQERKILCLPTAVLKQLSIRNIPKTIQLIMKHMCSLSCGKCPFSKTIRCPALEDDLCGSHHPDPDKKCPANKNCRSHPPRCKDDESIYCAFDLLQRYCLIKGFGKLCCNSCEDFENGIIDYFL